MSVSVHPITQGRSTAAVSARPAAAFVGGKVVANRSRLDTPIGKGAASEVWAAWDLRRERRLALKIVSLESRSVDDAWGRFEREARIYQKLQGPGFLPVHDFGFLGTHGFIAMDLLVGETLEERLKRRRKLSVAEVDAILEAIAQALGKAHLAGIVHRDLKPANIFLPHDNANTAAMLLDFGIAHVEEGSQRLTKPGMLLGSAAYMSPEQIRNGRAVDARSDLWAIGIILFRALSGERPFVGEKAEVLVSVLNDPPAAYPVDSGAPNLVPFFQRALQKDPAARFQSITELVASFRAAVAAERGSSERPTLVEMVQPPLAVAPSHEAAVLPQTVVAPPQPATSIGAAEPPVPEAVVPKRAVSRRLVAAVTIALVCAMILATLAWNL